MEPDECVCFDQGYGVEHGPCHAVSQADYDALKAAHDEVVRKIQELRARNEAVSDAKDKA